MSPRHSQQRRASDPVKQPTPTLASTADYVGHTSPAVTGVRHREQAPNRLHDILALQQIVGNQQAQRMLMSDAPRSMVVHNRDQMQRSFKGVVTSHAFGSSGQLGVAIANSQLVQRMRGKVKRFGVTTLWIVYTSNRGSARVLLPVNAPFPEGTEVDFDIVNDQAVNVRVANQQPPVQQPPVQQPPVQQPPVQQPPVQESVYVFPGSGGKITLAVKRQKHSTRGRFAGGMPAALGGHVEPQDRGSHQTALTREVSEETGKAKRLAAQPKLNQVYQSSDRTYTFYTSQDLETTGNNAIWNTEIQGTFDLDLDTIQGNDRQSIIQQICQQAKIDMSKVNQEAVEEFEQSETLSAIIALIRARRMALAREKMLKFATLLIGLIVSMVIMWFISSSRNK